MRLAALVGSAVGYLTLYRVSALVWERSPARALTFLRRWSVAAWRRSDIAEV